MTLRDLIARHRELFYEQVWYMCEPFLDAIAEDAPAPAPTMVTCSGIVPKRASGLPRAVDMAQSYVRDPHNAVWLFYLWCRDTDHLGQRLYMGVNDGKMEIHRHLAITKRWGVAAWI